MLEKLIAQLKSDFNFEIPQKEDKSYELVFSETITISFNPFDENFNLNSKLFTFKEVPGQSELSHLLLGNLFGQATGGGILSLNIEGKELFLTKTFDYDINYKDFRDEVEDFVNYCEFWEEEMRDFQKNHTKESIL
jgi:hypothetical protein